MAYPCITSSAPLVEDLAIRFLSCITRYILNYAQAIGKALPYVQYRDKRLFYKTAEVEEESKGFEAIDDGGIQCTRTQLTRKHNSTMTSKSQFWRRRETFRK